MSVRAPEGWKVDDLDAVGRTSVAMHSPDSSRHVAVTIRPDAPFDLKYYEGYALGYMRDVQAPKTRLLPRTTIAGIPAYHLRGSNGGSRYIEFGAVANNVQLSVRFQFAGDKSEDQAVIDEILKSVEWK